MEIAICLQYALHLNSVSAKAVLIHALKELIRLVPVAIAYAEMG
jgi:hypothetical protein